MKGQWSVDRDGVSLAVIAEPGGGTVTYVITPVGQRFVADVDTVEEIRRLEAAALATAQGGGHPAAPEQ